MSSKFVMQIAMTIPSKTVCSTNTLANFAALGREVSASQCGVVVVASKSGASCRRAESLISQIRGGISDCFVLCRLPPNGCCEWRSTSRQTCGRLIALIVFANTFFVCLEERRSSWFGTSMSSICGERCCGCGPLEVQE